MSTSVKAWTISHDLSGSHMLPTAKGQGLVKLGITSRSQLDAALN
jgi:hypothetical protein